MNSSFDLAHIFAQFRFDVVHTERCIYIGLILAGDKFQVWLLSPEEAIVIDGHVHAECPPP